MKGKFIPKIIQILGASAHGKNPHLNLLRFVQVCLTSHVLELNL